jgi:hypothetical protein
LAIGVTPSRLTRKSGDLALANRLFNFAALCSIIAFCVALMVLVVPPRLNTSTQRLRVAGRWYVSIDGYDDHDVRIVFFNAREGPYYGGILWNAGPHGVMPGTPTPVAFGDTLGIYYRSIPFPPSPTGTFWWKTLRISLIYPLVLASVLPLAWLFRQSRTKRKSEEFPMAGVARNHDDVF